MRGLLLILALVALAALYAAVDPDSGKRAIDFRFEALVGKELEPEAVGDEQIFALEAAGPQQVAVRAPECPRVLNSIVEVSIGSLTSAARIRLCFGGRRQKV